MIAFIPVYDFNLIPYLYEIFKPTLISHLIIFDEWPLWDNFSFDSQYFTDNYRNYWLSIGRLMQAFVANIVILLCIVIIHGVLLLMSKFLGNRRNALSIWVKAKRRQFEWNVYLRFYMLAYLDLTFFSVMKIVENDNSTTARKAAVFLAYVIFVFSIVIPVFLVSLVTRRFAVL